jgi:alkanesulfonate monooxygenase SsuD/methylene tetrahydromethanopterin reductase-like flavin-dependent oxidoreductase (luciferase family)
LLNLSATSKTDVQRYQEQDMIIIGTPEMCLEKIIRYDEAGVDQLLCYMQFGMLPHETVMHSIELLAEHVIPQLERRGHRVSATAVAV